MKSCYFDFYDRVMIVDFCYRKGHYIFKGGRIIFDLVDKSIIVFMNITIKDHHSEKRDQFVNQMEQLEEVTEFYHTSGSFDFLAKVRFSDIKTFRDFLVNEVASIHNISDIESQIVLEEIKYSTKIIL